MSPACLTEMIRICPSSCLKLTAQESVPEECSCTRTRRKCVRILSPTMLYMCRHHVCTKSAIDLAGFTYISVLRLPSAFEWTETGRKQMPTRARIPIGYAARVYTSPRRSSLRPLIYAPLSLRPAIASVRKASARGLVSNRICAVHRGGRSNI